MDPFLRGVRKCGDGRLPYGRTPIRRSRSFRSQSWINASVGLRIRYRWAVSGADVYVKKWMVQDAPGRALEANVVKSL